MNRTKLSGAKLDGAVLDQIWALAGIYGRELDKKAVFREPAARGKCDGADLSGARAFTPILSRASPAQGKFPGPILPPTMKISRWV